MKKISIYCVALLVSSAAYSQVHIDKAIDLSGSSASDRMITHLSAPVNGTDAVNKDYVDAQIATVAAGGGAVAWTHYKAFTASGIFSVPTGVSIIKVQVSGGG